MAAPATSGLPWATQAAFTACRVAKLSLQSSTTSASATSADSCAGPARSSMGRTCTSGLMRPIASAAEAALGMPTRAMSCTICRCRLVRSTVSSSTTVMRPTPAVARYSSTGEPSPPAPTTSACACSSRCWPSMPMSSNRMCRE